jgi:hypothetical protein
MTPVEEVFTPDGTFGGEVCPTECCSDWCKRCWWFGLRSTCDMPSHFPYPPAFHGYYYFQPYNYTHVLQHQQMAPLLGAEPFAPYEATNLQKIYVDVLGEEEAARPAGDGRLKSLTPDAGKLPLLEELLEGRHDLDSPRGRPGKVAPPKPGVEGKTAPPKKSGGKKSEPLPRTKGPFDE